MSNAYEKEITKNIVNDRNLILLGCRADADIDYLKERIKALELDLGLMTIARDNAAQLLKSCEQALDKANTH